ncbi:MAG: hypothetical protein KC609_20205 [Myxococcales bacterium]|nr:hypothetical protein [Myxococcales bacterium]
MKLIALCALFATITTATEAAPQDTTTASFEVRVIAAARERRPTRDPDISPRMARQLGRTFSKFNSFKLVKLVTFRAAANVKSPMALPGFEHPLQLTYLGMKKNFIRIYLELLGLRTQVRVHNGGTFFHATQRRRSLTIIAVTSRVP